MQSATPRDALTITAAAVVGAVVAARWWARHHPLSAPGSPAADRDQDELRLVLHDPAAALTGAPEDVLRGHWNRLHALDLAPASTGLPVAPTA
ncbi:hypothetical protein [Streptomyces similanensis]|uniref:Uncharacterized protein n=1 Tax=Streptomyces similanensis TaxID=1274988 RepID=A0ABP9KCJ0_9ACTN|nr:hypothetical protein HUT11_06335 [Streptomyces seoulensis]